jgi:hypothetical protein
MEQHARTQRFLVHIKSASVDNSGGIIPLGHFHASGEGGPTDQDWLDAAYERLAAMELDVALGSVDPEDEELIAEIRRIHLELSDMPGQRTSRPHHRA